LAANVASKLVSSAKAKNIDPRQNTEEEIEDSFVLSRQDLTKLWFYIEREVRILFIVYILIMSRTYTHTHVSRGTFIIYEISPNWSFLSLKPIVLIFCSLSRMVALVV